MNVLVVSNGTAAHARGRLAALGEALPESTSLAHRITRSAAELTPLVSHDGWRPDDLLVLNGGDGTVQHALSALLAGCPEDRLPRVALLPGGTTNMTANDINGSRKFGVSLSRLRGLVDSDATPRAAPRPLVRVEADQLTHCGFFFGVGTIVMGIEYFNARIRPSGGDRAWGAGLALLRTLWGMARRDPPFDESVALRLAGRGAPALQVRLALVTTLDRLLLGTRPFWGAGDGALKTTVVEARAPRFVRCVPRLLRGRPSARMSEANGWRSGRLDELRVGFRSSYTLDGELFTSPADTMRISATHPLRFVPL